MWKNMSNILIECWIWNFLKITTIILKNKLLLVSCRLHYFFCEVAKPLLEFNSCKTLLVRRCLWAVAYKLMLLICYYLFAFKMLLKIYQFSMSASLIVSVDKDQSSFPLPTNQWVRFWCMGWFLWPDTEEIWISKLILH